MVLKVVVLVLGNGPPPIQDSGSNVNRPRDFIVDDGWTRITLHIL